ADYRRQGVATTLLMDGIATLLPAGIKHLTLEVAAGNEAAQSLYRRFGFAPVGVRKGYYQVSGEDALIMWAYDIDTPEYAERLRGLGSSEG
ncbi:MAG TPA: GNAT family N-acetyltransferase, partial [Acidimicrobiales bacterium]